MAQEGIKAQRVYKTLQSLPRAYLQPSLYLLATFDLLALDNQSACMQTLDDFLQSTVQSPDHDHSEGFRDALRMLNGHLPATKRLSAKMMETYLARAKSTKKQQSILKRVKGLVSSQGTTEFTMIARLGKIREHRTWNAFSARYVVENTANLIEIALRFSTAIRSLGFPVPQGVESFGFQQNPRFFDRFFRASFPDEGMKALRSNMTIDLWKERKRTENLGDLELIVGPKGGVSNRHLPSGVSRPVTELRRDFSMIWQLEDQDVVGIKCES
ncbi:hypothetical protein CPB83DRAFT_848559 [Crepidotus variabilis]|uniref:Uncharacterized protein n=1 Tax=Crepidotus variabilis TaxID=179855 RepID=A0A9P6EMQ0_9AGAR|nr:hypothetical protein CPB83DRAFT_848559 [Crepidotus variabilis]